MNKNVCDTYNIDPATLIAIENLINSGRIELRRDHWNHGRWMFTCQNPLPSGEFAEFTFLEDEHRTIQQLAFINQCRRDAWSRRS